MNKHFKNCLLLIHYYYYNLNKNFIQVKIYIIPVGVLYIAWVRLKWNSDYNVFLEFAVPILLTGLDEFNFNETLLNGIHIIGEVVNFI